MSSYSSSAGKMIYRMVAVHAFQTLEQYQLYVRFVHY